MKLIALIVAMTLSVGMVAEANAGIFANIRARRTARIERRTENGRVRLLQWSRGGCSAAGCSAAGCH